MMPGYTSKRLISRRAIEHWISQAQTSMCGNLPHTISSSSPLYFPFSFVAPAVADFLDERLAWLP
jgi:hypothetical protein